MFDSGRILKGKITCWSLSGIKGLKEAGYYKNYNFWFKQVFEYESNIWCFHMLQDDQAEDGIKKEWTHL